MQTGAEDGAPVGEEEDTLGLFGQLVKEDEILSLFDLTYLTGTVAEQVSDAKLLGVARKIDAARALMGQHREKLSEEDYESADVVRRVLIAYAATKFYEASRERSVRISVNAQEFASMPRALQAVSGSTLGLHVNPRLAFDPWDFTVLKSILETYQQQDGTSAAAMRSFVLEKTSTASIRLLLADLEERILADLDAASPPMSAAERLHFVQSYSAVIDVGAFLQDPSGNKVVIACEVLMFFRRLRRQVAHEGGLVAKVKELETIVFYHDERTETGERKTLLVSLHVPWTVDQDEVDKEEWTRMCGTAERFLRRPMTGSEHDNIAKMLLSPFQSGGQTIHADSIKTVFTDFAEKGGSSYICLYDQARSIGFDLPNPPNARALVTVTSDTALDPLSQGAKRMRGLTKDFADLFPQYTDFVVLGAEEAKGIRKNANNFRKQCEMWDQERFGDEKKTWMWPADGSTKKNIMDIYASAALRQTEERKRDLIVATIQKLQRAASSAKKMVLVLLAQKLFGAETANEKNLSIEQWRERVEFFKAFYDHIRSGLVQEQAINPGKTFEQLGKLESLKSFPEHIAEAAHAAEQEIAKLREFMLTSCRPSESEEPEEFTGVTFSIRH